MASRIFGLSAEPAIGDEAFALTSSVNQSSKRFVASPRRFYETVWLIQSRDTNHGTRKELSKTAAIQHFEKARVTSGTWGPGCLVRT